MDNKLAKALQGPSSKPRATALNGSSPPTPPVIPTPQLGQQDGAPQSGGQQQQQTPAPSHNQTVAALRHFQIFLDLEKQWLNSPEMGKSDMRDNFIEGYTKLVADRIATPVQAIQTLATVPERPFEQKQWVAANMQRNIQARDIVLAHHAQAYAGMGPQPDADPDNHIADISSMMSGHYGQGNA